MLKGATRDKVKTLPGVGHQGRETSSKTMLKLQLRGTTKSFITISKLDKRLITDNKLVTSLPWFGTIQLILVADGQANTMLQGDKMVGM
jgi:hypothetical protein